MDKFRPPFRARWCDLLLLLFFVLIIIIIIFSKGLEETKQDKVSR